MGDCLRATGKGLDFKGSHTSITENAIRRTFDLQYIENITPNFRRMVDGS